MTRHSSLSQDLHCPCFGRGYVIDGAGDAVACSYCEAGATWAGSQAPAPEAVEAPELAPVVAGPARKVAAAPAPYVIAIRPAARTPERRAFDLAYAAELARCIETNEPEVKRTSTQAPGVTLTRRGRVITVEWFAGRTTRRNVYFIHQGRAFLVESPLRGTMPRAAEAHIERTLAAYVARLEAVAA